MMSAKSILANFISELDPNISIMLYRLALKSLDEVIRKTKMIEIDQRNASEVIQYNAKIA